MSRSKAGRPSHVPTDETRNLVESLSGFGIPVRSKNRNGRETNELGGVG